MEPQNDSHKLLRFLKETLNKMPPVAPVELFYDRQCKEIIKALCGLGGPIELLDYGCGNLRLLNGLLNTPEPLPVFTYTGTDIHKPDAKARKLLQAPHSFKKIKELREGGESKYDVVVLMNVIHEIALFDLANIFEDIRRLLKSGGKLYLVDMSILPEGEPLALPFFSWEFSDLFRAYEDKSYTSKTGIPVIFLEIKKEDIYYYPDSLASLMDLVQLKRNTFSDIAVRLNDPRELKIYGDLLTKVPFSGDSVYDLGKFMLMSGHANFRWMEEHNRVRSNNRAVAEAAISILKLFFDTFHQSRRIISPIDIFDSLGAEHSYDSLAMALKYMSGGFGLFFFPIRDARMPLVPSESIEAFEDRHNYDDIKKMGLAWLQSECYHEIYGG